MIRLSASSASLSADAAIPRAARGLSKRRSVYRSKLSGPFREARQCTFEAFPGRLRGDPPGIPFSKKSELGSAANHSREHFSPRDQNDDAARLQPLELPWACGFHLESS